MAQHARHLSEVESASEGQTTVGLSIREQFGDFVHIYMHVGPEGARYKVTVRDLSGQQPAYSQLVSEPRVFGKGAQDILTEAVDRALWAKAEAQQNVLTPDNLAKGFEGSSALRESDSWRATINKVLNDPEVASRWVDPVKAQIEAITSRTGTKRTRTTSTGKVVDKVASAVAALV